MKQKIVRNILVNSLRIFEFKFKFCLQHLSQLGVLLTRVFRYPTPTQHGSSPRGSHNPHSLLSVR